MNKFLKKYRILFIILAIVSVYSCDDNLTEITDFDTDRLFRPIGFKATMNKTEVTFEWVAVDGAVDYTLDISPDSLFATIVVSVTTSANKYVTELAGSTKYFARVKANASDPAKTSGFNARLSFTTPSENLFTGYVTTMIAMNTIEVKWLPNANATKLRLSVEGGETKYFDITPTEAAEGKKIISSLPNAKYKVELMNGDFVRGNVNVLVEGDVLVAAGQTLSAAISAATDGQVLLLEPGVLYQTGSGTYRFDKNLKIRGITSYNLPVLAMTAGTPTATSSMFGFVEGSTFNYLRFENIEFTGYCDNDVNAIKAGYLFNNNTLTNVGEVSFTNCILRNFSNTPFRVQGGKNQVIEKLKFDKCTIFDIGFGSTYAIVNSNSLDFVNDIEFNGCTIYNFKGSLVLRQTQSFKKITVRNCNINQAVMETASTRLLIDTNNSACLGEGIFIEKNIFGSSGNMAAGIRKTSPDGSFVVTGNYYTTDFIDQNPVGEINYSQKSKMTAYPKLSTDLWNDPIKGDFSFKDVNFAGRGTAGDLRWK